MKSSQSRCAVEMLENRQLFAAGVLDTSFDGDGVRAAGLAATDTMAMTSAGKYYVTGYNSVNDQIAIRRYTATGQLDTTFSGDGQLTINGYNPGFSSIAQTDGKLVLSAFGAVDDKSYLMRLNLDGSFDASWGVNGIAASAFYNGGSTTTLYQAKDGKILALGNDRVSPSDSGPFSVARYTTSGGIDYNFGANGKLRDLLAVGGRFSSTQGLGARGSIGELPDGRLVILADISSLFATGLASFYRLTANGQVDLSFNYNNFTGSQWFDPTAGEDRSHDMAMFPDGSFVVSGRISSTTDWAVWRYLPGTGSSFQLDTSFSGNGQYEYQTSPGLTTVTKVLANADGKTVITWAKDPTVGDASFYTPNLLRLTAAGVPDTTFGPNGNGRWTGTFNETMSFMEIQQAADGSIGAFGLVSDDIDGNDSYRLLKFGSETATPTLPMVTVIANDSSAGETGPNSGQFTVTRTGPTTSALTVYYGLPNATSGPTATNITDYLALGGSVTIGAGQSSATITVVPIDDSAVEGTETVALALSSGFGYTLGGQVSAAVTITDNDTTTPPPTNPPAAPSGIAGTVVSGNRIDVRWTDNANNETGFEIQRSLVYNFLSPTNVTVNTANLSSYSDTTLNPNTYYYFRVRARNAAGVSSWSSSVKLKTSSSTTTPTIPAAPTNPSATADSSSQITVRWTDTSNNETGFRILRYNSDPNDPFISTTPTYFTVGAGVTSFVDTGHSPNTTRWYHVQSYNAAGNSVYSSRVSATTFPVVTPTVPAAPTSPGATANSSSQITVTWGDASNNETGFRIQRSTTSNFASVTEFTVGAGVTSFVNTGLTANTTYYYRVQSYNGTGPSAYTTGVNATTQAAPVGGTGPLTAPTSLAVTVSRLSALVNWNDNSNNETGWEIQISTVYNFTAATSRIVSVPTINAETFNVTGLNAGTWYYFRVRAVNTTNVSSWTGSIKLKTLS